MLAACEADEVLALLEGGGGGGGGSREAGELAGALYAAVREPWLVRALLGYHARTGSTSVIELLARAPEPHARHLLDALTEQLRGEPGVRRAALAALAPLVARRPAWLPRLPPPPAPPHPLPRELLRCARTEREPLPLLHALLALAALLPAAPALAAPLWPELADALLRPHSLSPAPPAAARAHLRLAQLALFHALYATHPCTLLEALRAELGAGGAAGAAAREAWERGLRPLLASVRLHPQLVCGSRAREADAARRLEEHDVVAETRRLTLGGGGERRGGERSPAPPEPLPPPAVPAPGSGAAASRAAGSLRPGAEPWFALVDRCGADSAPHTPLPGDMDAAEPPEAAVEATPENTPAKETRAAFRFPSESTVARAIGRRSAGALASVTSPEPAAAAAAAAVAATTAAAGEAAPPARLARVLSERRAADSPVPMQQAPPPLAHRPEPRAATATTTALTQVSMEEVTPALGRRLAPPRAPRRPAAPPRPRARPPRRSSSCAPAPRARTRSVAVQTVDTWHEPYEFIIADFYRSLPDDDEEEGDPLLPCERLDAYLTSLYSGPASAAPPAGELREQLALTHAQLMYERWRREAHAERNRRLLGRCRQARAQELQAAALRDRERAAVAERDELRARLEAEKARSRPTPAGGAADERVARLEAALLEERAARARAEAAAHEAELARAAAAESLSGVRAANAETARQLDALARAAAAAERRAGTARRLRHQLLVLAERDQRLAASAAEAPQPPQPLERALRAALPKAEAEAAAAAARADAATARADALESLLAARDAALADMKRATRLAAEEHAARTRALRDKYTALMRVLRAHEARQLQRLAGGEPASLPTSPAPAAAAPAADPAPPTLDS